MSCNELGEAKTRWTGRELDEKAGNYRRLYSISPEPAAFHIMDSPSGRKFPSRPVNSGRADDTRRAWRWQHPRQQARRRWRNAEGHLPPPEALVAGRPPHAAAKLPAGPRHHLGGRLVRRPERPALQPAGPARARPQWRPAQARGPPL